MASDAFTNRMVEDHIRQRFPGREMLTVSHVAQLLNVHPNSVRRWADQGLLRAYRVGQRGDRRFWPEDIARFLEFHGGLFESSDP